MKKIIFGLLLILISSSIFAITPNLTVGMQNANINGAQLGKYYVDISIEQEIGDLQLYGLYRNEMNLSSTNPIRFAPTQDYFTIGASYSLPFAKLTIEHMCMHPVVSQSHWSGLQGGYTRFEVQI
jgi:hypothetical protein